MNKLQTQMWQRVAKKLDTTPSGLKEAGWDWLDILDFHSFFFGGG